MKMAPATQDILVMRCYLLSALNFVELTSATETNTLKK